MSGELHIGGNPVIITAQASHGENGFKFLPKPLAVRANLARDYGYPAAPLPFPTVMDGMIAMHRYEPASMARFYLNGKMPEDRQRIGYTADKAPLRDGDLFEFWLYTDPSGACLDFYNILTN